MLTKKDEQARNWLLVTFKRTQRTQKIDEWRTERERSQELGVRWRFSSTVELPDTTTGYSRIEQGPLRPLRPLSPLTQLLPLLVKPRFLCRPILFHARLLHAPLRQAVLPLFPN